MVVHDGSIYVGEEDALNACQTMEEIEAWQLTSKVGQFYFGLGEYFSTLSWSRLCSERSVKAPVQSAAVMSK